MMVVALPVPLPPLLIVLFCLATTGVGVASAGGVRFAAVLVPRPPRPRALPLPLEGGATVTRGALVDVGTGASDSPSVAVVSLRFASTWYCDLVFLAGCVRRLAIVTGIAPPVRTVDTRRYSTNVMDLYLDSEVTLTRGCVLASLREAAAVYRLSVRTVSGVTLVYRPEAGRVEGDDCEHIYYTIKHNKTTTARYRVES